MKAVRAPLSFACQILGSGVVVCIVEAGGEQERYSWEDVRSAGFLPLLTDWRMLSMLGKGRGRRRGMAVEGCDCFVVRGEWRWFGKVWRCKMLGKLLVEMDAGVRRRV